MPEVDDVQVYRGRSHVLQGMSLRVAEGEVPAVLGRNGTGRTALTRSTIGFTPPHRRSVRFRGGDVTRRLSYRMVGASFPP